MRTLNVDLADRSYPIFINKGLLSGNNLLSPYIKSRQVMIVTNETVAPLYLSALQTMLDGYDVHVTLLPDGESYKTLAQCEFIFESLLRVPCDRNVTLIALGGGVIGDICGFAAGCYQRGVPFIQIPTTLLAQVDSSVGGKTAVNSTLGKNMIGLFYQPSCVLIDINVLQTLASREISAGCAEVIKTALLDDYAFFEWLENNIESLISLEEESLSYAIEQCCRIKSRVVSLDEKEHGIRALLNLGHTFAHAIETGMGHGIWLHGEAVGAGMCMAADMSVRCGLLTVQQQERIVHLIDKAGLPTKAPSEMNGDQFIELMRVDKKVVDNNIQLILLKELGQAELVNDYNMSDLEMTIEQSCATR